MQILALTADHSTVALRFALLASVTAENATDEEQEARSLAQDAAHAALARVVAHVPLSCSELRLKADYLASRLAMGDDLGPDMVEALLAATSQFYPHFVDA